MTDDSFKGYVLWVDDDPDIIQAHRDEIDDLGYRVELARTPDEMWQKLEQLRPALKGIILDILMPTGEAMDYERANGGLRTGLVLAEELRKSEQYRDLPIVIFTIRAAHDVDEFGLRHGIKVLRKYDTSVEELANVVQQEFK